MTNGDGLSRDERALQTSGVIERMGQGALAERMGIVIVDAHPDRVVATMPVEGNTQPMGLLHGGANAVLAESVGSLVAFLNGGGRIPVGVDLSCTHHRGATSGTVTAVGTPLSVGRTIVCADIRIHDDEGRAVCTARLTCLVRSAAG